MPSRRLGSHLGSCIAAILAIAAPRWLHAQYLPSPIPRSVHNWIGVEVGGAYVKSARGDQHAAEAVLRADIATRVASHLVLDVDALLFARISDTRIVCPLAAGGGAPDCPSALDVLPSQAITATLGRELGRVHDTPRLVIGAGVGAYGVHDGDGFYFGVHGAAKLVLAELGRMQIAATVQPLLLPNVPGGRLWAVPITIGVRAH
jgi:hypothetical protein